MYVYVVSCSDNSDAAHWANINVEHVVQHGGLSVMTSDRAPQLKVLLIRSVWISNGVCPLHATLKLLVRLSMLKESMRISCFNMIDWDPHFCLAQFALNNAWHDSVQQTPFFLKHGRSPKMHLAVVTPHRPVLDNPA